MFTIPCPLREILTPPSIGKESPFPLKRVLMKVEFRVNGDKVEYPMKLGEGGEAFFVFQTEGDIPEEMQTSPVVSPDQSPVLANVMSSVFPSGIRLIKATAQTLQEPDYLDLNNANGKLEVKDDNKSDSNVQLHKPIDIVRPASTDGPHPW